MIANVMAVNPVSLALEEDRQGQYRRGSHVRTDVGTSWCMLSPAKDHLEPLDCEQDCPVPLEPMGQEVDLPTL